MAKHLLFGVTCRPQAGSQFVVLVHQNPTNRTKPNQKQQRSTSAPHEPTTGGIIFHFFSCPLCFSIRLDFCLLCGSDEDDLTLPSVCPSACSWTDFCSLQGFARSVTHKIATGWFSKTNSKQHLHKHSRLHFLSVCCWTTCGTPWTRAKPLRSTSVTARTHYPALQCR